jgi:hypothetical protein
MRILIAGASGAIGRALVPRLRANQHDVFALTQSRDSAAVLKELSAEPVIADALDAAAVKTAVGEIRPDAVINELTSLPRHYTPADMKAAARYWTWAVQMGWAFDPDVLRCPRCAGRMELIATSTTPPSFTASSPTSRCRAHGTTPAHGRCVSSPRETSSPRFPSHSCRDLVGPAARAVVCPEPPAPMGPRHAGRFRLTTPTASGSIAARWQGVVRAVP